jgi:multidrug efflux pump subunit AcrB
MDRVMSQVRKFYQRTLGVALNHRWTVVFLAAVFLCSLTDGLSILKKRNVSQRRTSADFWFACKQHLDRLLNLRTMP